MVTRHLRSRRRARALATVRCESPSGHAREYVARIADPAGHRRGRRCDRGRQGRSIRRWSPCARENCGSRSRRRPRRPDQPLSIPTAGAARRVGDHRAGRAQHLEDAIAQTGVIHRLARRRTTRRTPGATRRPRQHARRHREVLDSAAGTRHPMTHLWTARARLAGRHDPTEIAGSAISGASAATSIRRVWRYVAPSSGRSQVGSNPGPDPPPVALVEIAPQRCIGTTRRWWRRPRPPCWRS